MDKTLTNRRYFAKLLKRTKIAENIIELRFKLETHFDFIPGQYVRLEVREFNFPDQIFSY